MSVLRLSHVGLCVSDLERSLAFYRDALGFREVSALEVSGAETDRLLELEGVELRAVYLERDGARIELLCFDSPPSSAEPTRRPLNRLGLTHLSLRVDDLDAAIRAVERAGGSCLEATRIENPRFETRAVFVVDPDGQRIELLQTPGDPSSLPGGG
jgi:catechol 2,3-dioxygenase-like lactoylglutathione lyase family enzyme